MNVVQWKKLCDPSKTYVVLVGLILLFTTVQSVRAKEDNMKVAGGLLAGVVGAMITVFILQWLCKAGNVNAAWFVAVGLPAALVALAYLDPSLVKGEAGDPFSPLYSRAVTLGQEI